MKNTHHHALSALAVLTALSFTGCTFDPPEFDDAGDTGAWTFGDVSSTATDGGGSLDAPPTPDAAPDTPPTPDADPSDAARDAIDPSDDAGSDASADASADASTDASEPDMATTLTQCEGVMVDLEADPNNCGACGTQCDEGFGVCDAGACGCALPELEVCRSDQRCLDLQRDPNNCGTCDFACIPGAACVGGSCECRPGLTLCDGECVDTNINANHCGGCGMGCGGDACRDASCTGSCNLLDFRCDEGPGTSCIAQPPRSGNHLYCHSAGQLTCGKRCGGDQICWDPPGFFDGLDCHDYRPARGCETCPCDDCTGDEECLDGNGLSGVAWCVAH